ncbi:MAG: hypothetical protein QT00_C0002G0144 [archaeon GW2011_AR5]|nr:MAG: hypothetical protein QT00_C0002G0144 [archaeon GW2011_AR5]MBS3051128.1 hypothetical protein [Candidatus Aenigmarchaeota archaeon]
MANRHVKTINGRKYYYESIRRGKKVTSKYIGPVDERKRRSKKAEMAAEQDVQLQQETAPDGDENYIG